MQSTNIIIIIGSDYRNDTTSYNYAILLAIVIVI